MATPNTIIQGVNYKSLTPNNVNYVLSPFDGNGNLIPSVTLSVDTTTTATTVYLPEIATLSNNWSLQVDVVLNGGGGGNNCIVSVSGTDTIGSASDVTLSTVGANVVLRPVENGVWSVVTSN